MVELQIEEFYDSRQAHCKAEDYLIIVEKVKEKFAFCIQIVWRPDDIKEPWEKWAYAHINLEITKDLDDKSGEKEFRRALSMADIFTFDPT
ncbi:MAG: hypothetical protein OXL41_12880 [Nitrospinae bacterium]|nr:hypothetical protein [Nitrospinota bacterium]